MYGHTCTKTTQLFILSQNCKYPRYFRGTYTVRTDLPLLPSSDTTMLELAYP